MLCCSRYIKVFVSIVLVHNSACADSEQFFPVLLWHSAGETCCGKEGNLYANFIRDELNQEVSVRSVKLGTTTEDDFTLSLSTHPFDQISYVCNKLKQNKLFQDGYNAIGFSQGALLLRGLAQTCPFPPMKNLISLGGPQQGVVQFPRCEQRWGARNCETLQRKINFKAYRRLIQNFLTPTTYWHDLNEERYRRGSTFLAVINNENNYNVDYVEKLQSLRRFILVKYKNDVSLVPNESSWFGFYNNESKIIPMEETELYQSNKLGLKQLVDNGKLIRLESPLEHLQLDKIWFRENIIPVLKEK